MKKKIHFLESSSSMGGVEFSTLYLTQHLDRTVWEPLVICPTEGDLPQACRQSGVPVAIQPLPSPRSTSFRFGIDHRLPNPISWAWNLPGLLVAALRLRRFFRQHPPDLIVTKGLTAHFYGGLAAHLAGNPCIWHLQDFISERYWGLFRWFLGLVARHIPDHIIVDGTPIAHQLPADIQERVSVVLNGVDAQVFHPGLDGAPVRRELDIPLEALVIGNVARLTPWKGQHHLLDVFAHLAPEFPNAYLLLVGSPVFGTDRYERRLKERTQELELEGRVIFAGYRRDLPQVLAAMDIFAYTAVEKDTSPLALLSAMAAGLPVVAFDIPGVEEVLEESGLLTPPKQSKPMAAALQQLLEDPDCRNILAQDARTRFESCFRLEHYVSSNQKIFHKVVWDG